MTDETPDAPDVRKTMRFTQHEIVRMDALAAEQGISRAQLLRDLTDDFIDGVIEVDAYETSKVEFWCPAGQAARADAKAQELGVNLRDVLRAAVAEAGRA